MYSLNKENAVFFQTELSRMEQTTSSTNLSQMLMHSRENMFLSEVLLRSADFRFLRWRHSEILSKALRRSSENMAMASSQWGEFSNLFYISRGRPVPKIPLYVEIQEGLGVYGRGPLERFLRKCRRGLEKRLNVWLDKVFGPSGPPEES